MSEPDEDKLRGIAKYHLEMVKQYDPYANFDGVSNRPDFVALIARDPAFRNVGFADDKYVIARIGGNLITSLHRKLGDMYEAMFRYLLKTRFGVPEEDLGYSVEVTIGGRQQERSTDGLLRRKYMRTVELPSLPPSWKNAKGLGFEVRSCYQIGDSKRIQADYDMALALAEQGILPVMLVFCQTSLRSPVARLKRSWQLFEGEKTFSFIHELTGFDLLSFMERNKGLMSAPVRDLLVNL